MGRSLYVTLRFFGHLMRDLAGTFAARWRRFRQRVVLGEHVASVAVDIFPFFEKMTGVGWYEWHLLAALDERDDGLVYNLYGHTFLAPDEPAPPVMPGERRMRLRVHHMPSSSVLPPGPTVRLLRATMEPFLRWLDGNEVAFAPNFFLPPRMQPFGKTVVATVHDLAFAVMPETVAPETLANLRRHIPATLFGAQRLVAVSDATARDVVERLGASRRRVHTIHSGLAVDAPDDAAPPPHLPERFVLFVSTLEPRKNVIGVLRAFRLLVERHGYMGSLVLVGRWGWHTEELREELVHSPVRQRIRHLDYVDRSELWALYRRAELLLFPSWLEGFGFPVLEAMACGTPVVTSNCSGTAEIAGSAAQQVDPARPEEIAEAAARVLNEEALRDHLREAGRRRAAQFSWAAAAAATAQVLRAAAGLVAVDHDEHRV